MYLGGKLDLTPIKQIIDYKNEVLIKVIGEILPNDEYGWQVVAIAYQSKAKEEALHDSDNLKKHWIRNLCNNMKKLTGWTGEKGDWIHRCIAIKKKIMDKTHSGMIGFSSEEDNRILLSEGGEEQSVDEFGGGENDLSGDGPGDIAADVFPDNATESQQDTTVGNRTMSRLQQCQVLMMGV
jgi:hypothetical protein